MNCCPSCGGTFPYKNTAYYMKNFCFCQYLDGPGECPLGRFICLFSPSKAGKRQIEALRLGHLHGPDTGAKKGRGSFFRLPLPLTGGLKSVRAGAAAFPAAHELGIFQAIWSVWSSSSAFSLRGWPRKSVYNFCTSGFSWEKRMGLALSRSYSRSPRTP